MRNLVAFLAAAMASSVCIGQDQAAGVDEFDEIYEEARLARPDRPVTESFFEVARKRAAMGIGDYQNIGHVANYLADHFSLYTRVQSEVIKLFCSAQGVDIQPFLDALASAGTQEAEATAKIYARLGVSYEPIWADLKAGAIGMADSLVAEAEATVGVPAGQLCAHLGGSPGESAVALSYSRVKASRSEILKVIAE